MADYIVLTLILLLFSAIIWRSLKSKGCGGGCGGSCGSNCHQCPNKQHKTSPCDCKKHHHQ